ncbi:hypothetical protein C0991_001769 [Blastosporella zonata]|nr:hypothetical protein C0991_001769 [Blastosporella zonata]
MPSFRTIFAVAATAFAALSSAAPIADGTNQVAQLVGVSNVANDVAHNVNVNGVDVTVVDLGKRMPQDITDIVNGIFGGEHKREEQLQGGLDGVVGSVTDIVDGILGSLDGEYKREEQLQSLPAILVSVQAKLQTVSGELTALVNGKVNVDVEILKPVIAEVHDIVAGAVVSVKLLVGSPVDFILTLDGKVLAAVDVCHILVSVLVLVHSILSLVLQVVASVSIKVVAPLIAAIGSLLVELLVCIFVDLKAGIFVAIGPLLTPTLYNALVAINLDIVVAVLKKGTN